MTPSFYLVLVIWAQSGIAAPSVAMTTAVIPQLYTREDCFEAGHEAKKNYNGGALVTWTCVPETLEETTNG